MALEEEALRVDGKGSSVGGSLTQECTTTKQSLLTRYISDSTWVDDSIYVWVTHENIKSI